MVGVGPGYALLSSDQVGVARRVIEEESSQRDHLVVYLSGAHAYGFPSPDSDLDLKAIHVAPTRELAGLAPPALVFDRTGFVDGIEIDYTSNEIGNGLAGILKGNGNFIERVLGSAALVAAPAIEGLAPVVGRSLSRRVHRHYRGFAANQLAALEATPTVKKLLYVLRTTLTGRHLLRSGELVCDVTQLLEEAGPSRAMELVEAKRAGENVALEGPVLVSWKAEVGRAFERLDEALASSVLPEEPANVDEVAAWLVALRRARF